MSQINVNTIKKADGTGNLTVPAESGQVVTTASPSLGRRNLIINGAMQVAQRGTSSTGITSSGYYTCDRWYNIQSNDATLTQTKEADAPSGFASSIKNLVTTADTSIGADQYQHLQYRIEGQDLQGLAYGTSDAKAITCSFWVKSNKTGTYCVSFSKVDNTRYDYIAEYTIDSSDTWEYKTFTVSPDSNIQASGGAIDNDNNNSLSIKFILATGSNRQGTVDTWTTSTPADATSNQVNFLDTVDNYWQITGVQLEVGDVATPFEHRSYGEEHQACLRYFRRLRDQDASGELRLGTSQGAGVNSTRVDVTFEYPVQMRATPTLIRSAASNFGLYPNASAPSNIYIDIGTKTTMNIICTTSGATANYAYQFFSNNQTDIFDLDAEL